MYIFGGNEQQLEEHGASRDRTDRSNYSHDSHIHALHTLTHVLRKLHCTVSLHHCTTAHERVDR